MNIAVRNLGFSYPNGKNVLKNLTFDIAGGSILSILGPNGAGKSTLLNCLARLCIPTIGDVLFNGKSYRRMSQREIACAIGYVPQSINPAFHYSVLEYIVTGCAPRMGAFQKPRQAKYDVARATIEGMGLEHIAEQSILRISGGERQQVSIARVLAQKPAVILLDEPTAHLDFGNQVKVLKILRRLAREGYGIVMTTHNPDHVLLLEDHVAVLDQGGNLTYGLSQDILTEAFLLSVYDTKLRLIHIDELGRKVCVAQDAG